jgi:hypothetical protein
MIRSQKTVQSFRVLVLSAIATVGFAATASISHADVCEDMHNDLRGFIAAHASEAPGCSTETIVAFGSCAAQKNFAAASSYVGAFRSQVTQKYGAAAADQCYGKAVANLAKRNIKF